jgi:hypothetical protein
MRPASLFSWKVVSVLLASSACLVTPEANAQYGAAPSQTGLFFDDFRSRQQNFNTSNQASAGTRDGDTMYDYDSGVYRANEDSMGQRANDFEMSRAMSRPDVRSGSNAYSARNVGDFTNYAGQYTSPTSFFAPTYVSDPFLDGKRNVKLGPVNLGFGLYQAFEYNDNVNRGSDGNEISDVISSTMVRIDANYQVTQNNRLSLSTAIGFDRYFENQNFAPYGDNGFALNILPGSTLAFDIKAGPVYITVYDRFSVRPATRNDFSASRNLVFGVFQNDLGVAANWQINSDWTLSLNLMNSMARSISEEQDISGNPTGNDFSQFNRTTNSLQGTLAYSPNRSWVIGAEGGVTQVEYDEDFNNNGLLNNLGAFVVLPIGSATTLRAAAGIQIFEFDVGPSPVLGGGSAPSSISSVSGTGDTSDLSDFYYNLTLTNRLNSRVIQSLSVGHESSLNILSNYVTADYINYGISFVAWKGSRINLSAYTENAQTSGGVFNQDTLQYGFDAYLTHRLNSRTTFGLGYHYGYTDVSNQGNFYTTPPNGNELPDFTQHAFNIDLTYALSAKASLNLGYRYYTTEAQSTPTQNGSDFSYDQSRIILGLNYNF